MGAYLVTGSSGTGKSTVIEQLKKRGFTAYDTDDLPEVTRLQDLQTGKIPDEWPPRPVDWSRYGWNWQEKGLKKLLMSDATVFIAAITSNQEKFYDLFDTIFVLTLDTETIKHRVLTRSSNDYGKNPGELANILSGNARMEKRLLTPGAIEIKGSQPIEKVVDEILKYTEK